MSSSRTSTRPSTSSALVRPAPARKGQPASSRNFAASSAGGATSHLYSTTRGERERDRDQNKTEEVTLSEQQVNKVERWGDSYVPSEETIRNDYSGEYVETGQRPQNYIRNAQVDTRFSEYPKLGRLLSRKHSLTRSPRYSIPPTYINPPPTSVSPTPIEPCLAQLVTSGCRFDSILLTPPRSTSFSQLSLLPLSSLAANPGFIWLWVGTGQQTFDPLTGRVNGTDGIGLERGRQLLAGWGYRRCEDIVWLKTNKRDPEGDLTREPTSLFTPTVEHCLMGIRGTVRRSTDSWFVHCNVDTDVLVWEGDDQDLNLKPPELQSLIENFCLGTRRLHLFGSKNSLRRGWLTVASPEEAVGFTSESTVRQVENEMATEEDGGHDREAQQPPREWDKEEWKKLWESHQVSPLLPFDQELDSLRPKSPPPRNGQPSSGGLGRGRGAGLGITRSGLVTQASSRGPPLSPSVTTREGTLNGSGRGRGRGSGFDVLSNGNSSLPAKPPLATSNGYYFASSPAPSPSHIGSYTSKPPPPPTDGTSPYRIHSIPQPHPLPSRPPFSSQHSSSYPMRQPRQNASPSNYLTPPAGGGGSGQPYASPQFQNPSASTYPPPGPEQLYYYTQHQQQLQEQQRAYQYANQSRIALPQAPAPVPTPPSSLHYSLSSQFSQQLSLSQSQHGHAPYPLSNIAVPPLLPPSSFSHSQQQTLVDPNPYQYHRHQSPAPPPPPSLSHSTSNPYLFPPTPVPVPNSISSASTTGEEGDLEEYYPISSNPSRSRRASSNHTGGANGY